jgi:6-pyruvoyl-tetrahydropterin synthase-like protein
MTRAPVRHACAVAALVAAAVVFCLPLFGRAGLPFGSDLGFASQSAHGFLQALREGVAYPRWVDVCNRGFGSPTFIFYPPLAYYLTAFMSLFTADVVGAMRAALVVGTLLSGLSFYLSARPGLSSPAAAAGAILYTLLPYRSLDVYDRFAFAEVIAFIWFPPLFACTRRLIEGRSRPAWFGLSLCYAGLIATHLVTAFMLPFALVPYAVLLAARGGRWRRLAPVAGALALALGLTGIYFVPMLAQRGLVHMDWVVQASYGDWRRNFVYRNEVAFGFTPAPIKPWVAYTAGSQALLAAGAAGAILFFFIRRHAPRPTGDGAAPRIAVHEALSHLGVAAWCLFLQVPWSAPIWRMTPELGTVQFPWRFGPFQGLAGCFLVGSAFDPRLRPPSRRATAILACVLAALSLPALAASHRFTLNREFMFDEEQARRGDTISRVMFEYIPRGVESWQRFEEIPYAENARAALEPPGAVEVVEWTTHGRRLRIDSAVPALLRVRTFAYPGWEARLDGVAAPIEADNRLLAATIRVPAGRHDVEMRFGSTTDRRLGAGVSLLSIATMLALAAAARGSRVRDPARPTAAEGGRDGARQGRSASG